MTGRLKGRGKGRPRKKMSLSLHWKDILSNSRGIRLKIDYYDFQKLLRRILCRILERDSYTLYWLAAPPSGQILHKFCIKIAPLSGPSAGMPEPRVQRVQLHPLPFLFTTLWVHNGCRFDRNNYQDAYVNHNRLM